jgi:hypothetical protein
MQRTTIMLPYDLKTKATRFAASHELTLGGLIRQALKEVCLRKSASMDVFFADKDFYQGDTPGDLSSNHDNYLY